MGYLSVEKINSDYGANKFLYKRLYITNILDYDFAYNTFGSSNPDRSKYSFRGIIKAAKLAVYNERKTTANKAHILFMNLKI